MKERYQLLSTYLVALGMLIPFEQTQGNSVLTLDLTGFDPHIGQLFEARVVNIADGMEVGRTRVDTIAATDFSVTISGLEVGDSYNVDFYADFNDNGLYDAPITDLAWRLALDNVQGDTTLTFAHNTNFTDIEWVYLLTLDLTGMTPHVGQLFEARVVDMADGMEVGRARVDAIPSADFSVSIADLEIGHSYNVDFYADFNDNGLYDSPITDLAWRLALNNVQGDTTLTFSYNTNFTDIEWVYLLTLDLTGMTPHLGQLFEARVVDMADGMEVGRTRVDAIAATDFSVTISGLEVGDSYNVDFYADFNDNGLYDAPPTDHAWRLALDNVQGDTTLTFAHNTDFTDIQWYSLTLELTAFVPHVGQLFEARVVNIADGMELGRTRVDAIAAADFSVTISGLEVGDSYNVDFYADFNGSGYYDLPPTDHAWRLALDNVQGDTTLTFSHNTNFTDIAWPYALTLELTGFTPHLGQLFEARVVDIADGMEVGRTRVDTIPAADFSVTIGGLEGGHSYNVDFFADFNGSGYYDPPPTDHAWRLALDNVQGDTTLTFSHNTNFTDIEWVYFLTLDLTGFNPHVGQLFETRVVNIADGMEVGRTRVDAIAAADFSVTISGLEVGDSYNVDFYADFNDNGLYDAPITDLAWRLALDNVQGDTTLTFNHNTNFTDIEWVYFLTLDLTGMTPHVGQLFEARVVNIADGMEVGRTRVDAIAAADFSVTISGLEVGDSYNVDFYADFNDNGLYDAPITDLAWRLALDNVQGNTTLTFSYNTNFTDIEWVYLLTLDLTGMTPHLGQLFEARVVDLADGMEVGRTRVDAISTADFSVSIAGLEIGHNYNVDFYADFNDNGLYDSPSTDHAWRLSLDNVQGDTALTFSHNTDFTDIEWVYLLTLDLTGMTPHLGQLFEARVVDMADGMEVGRTTLDSIPFADFSVSIAGLEIGHSYNVDFFADFNDNGMYDAPPTDHAWRLTLEDVQGDTTLNFSHNTNFTDIEADFNPSPILLSEIVVTPTAGEFIEIYNPNESEVDLSNFYLTDATFSSDGTYYYNIVTDFGYGGGGFGDFHARFPYGATIAPGEYQTIGLNGDADFFDEYGLDPTYEIDQAEHASGTPDDIPDMREAVMYSIFGSDSTHSPGLTNGDEVVILYYWDGISDLVQDSDYLIYDDADAVPNEAVDKTGVSIDGPDADSDSSTYLNDTPIANQHFDESPSSGFSLHRIDYTEGNEVTTGGNGIDSSDETSEDTDSTFAISLPTPGHRADLGIYQLTLDITGFDPHVGQLFEARVFDIADGVEVGRTRVDAVPSADFSVTIGGLEGDHSYKVDFFADFNGNGYYDAPPTDHAWQLSLDNVQGDTTLTFSHNTDFTDIGWDYLLTLDLTGMTPHVGQLFEARVLDMADGMEVERTRVDAVPSPDFSVTIRGLEIGHSYNVDFFADFNGNGYYDAPPTDHAWRLLLENVQGDTTLSFSHNTNFTDIEWTYALTFELTGLDPHIGQLFEAQLYDTTGEGYYARYRIDSITDPDFEILFEGIESGLVYYIDFYADFNENGYYDPPPTDHAWRLLLENVQGNTTISFAHNTDFTDIEWRHALYLELRDFTPHLGQLFEARLVDITSGGYVEVAVQSIDSIPEADFDLGFHDLEGGHTYNVDFYADFNDNGMYDAPPTDHAWRLLLADVQGDTTLTFDHNTDFTDIEWGVDIDPEALLPDRYTLHQNYPNPFNPVTTIAYDIPEAADVRIDIYNVLGQKVRTLVNSMHEAAFHKVVWNSRDDYGKSVPSGMYIYRITATDPSSGKTKFTKARKLVMIK